MPTTLTVARRTLAALLGELEVGTADAGVSTAVLGCATALASGARIRSTVLPPSFFRGKWLHLPDATVANDRDRLIATYDPVAGYLYPDEPWTVSPGGLTFEILGLFSGADLNALLNEALQQLYVLRDLTFTVTSQNVRRHQLNATAPWLKSWGWIYQLGSLVAGESWAGSASLVGVDPYRRVQHGEGYDRAGEVWIEGPTFLPTDTAYALCACRAYDLCRPAAGVYGDQSGLVLETDEAPVDPEWLAWAAVVRAANRLDHLAETGQADEAALRARQMAAARVTELTRDNWAPPERTFSRPRTFIGATRPGTGVRW